VPILPFFVMVCLFLRRNVHPVIQRRRNIVELRPAERARSITSSNCSLQVQLLLVKWGWLRMGSKAGEGGHWFRGLSNGLICCRCCVLFHNQKAGCADPGGPRSLRSAVASILGWRVRNPTGA
jgi:hypothetical protein